METPDDPGLPRPPKKRSRKAQIKELAEKRRAKNQGSAASSSATPAQGSEDHGGDPDYVVDDSDEEEEPVAARNSEQPGLEAKRQNALYRKRVSRFRGLTSEARVMETWLSTSQVAVDAGIVELAKSTAARACANALKIEKEESEERRRLENGAAERRRYEEKKRSRSYVSPEPRAVRPRVGTTYSDDSKKRKAGAEVDTGSSRKRQRSARLSLEMKRTIERICKPENRQFQRKDVIGGNR